MNPGTNNFNQLLERYIFKVANHHIDSADSATQPGIIDLWQTVNETLQSEASLPVASPAQPTEWEAVLQAPVDWRSVNKQWLQGIIRERGRQHAMYLSRLREAIAVTHFHLQTLQTSQLSEHRRTKLTVHYQRTLLMYQQQLTQAERTHASYLADSTDKP